MTATRFEAPNRSYEAFCRILYGTGMGVMIVLITPMCIWNLACK